LKIVNAFFFNELLEKKNKRKTDKQLPVFFSSINVEFVFFSPSLSSFSSSRNALFVIFGV